MAEVQDRRRDKAVPLGRRLHDYVNLYVNGRNAMLFKRLTEVNRICVLQVSPDVLDLPGVVITDYNAASDYARFATAFTGLRLLNRAEIFARYWIHGDEIETMRHRSRVCAEVLVPDCVPPALIGGAYVAGADIGDVVSQHAPGLRVIVNRYLFFR